MLKRTLWIDQICINQSSLEEKKQQVQLMRDIYKYCRRCLVWLGEIKEHVSVEDADRGWEVLTYMSAAGKAGNYKEIPLPVAMSSGQEAVHDAIKALWTLAGQGQP